MKRFIFITAFFLSIAHAEKELPVCTSSLSPGKTCIAAIDEVHPTQPEVGWHQVEKKAKEFEKLSKKELKKLKRERIVPSIIAPNGEFYIIDHHHTALALYKIGEKEILVKVVENWSNLLKGKTLTERMKFFWEKMEYQKFCYLKLSDGSTISPLSPQFPRMLNQCRNNPYRALTWELIEKGIITDGKVPYYEFYISELLQKNGIFIDEQNFKQSIKQAEKLLKTPAIKKTVKKMAEQKSGRDIEEILSHP